jgi:ribosomal-protein-alanine N-acetyltransferase
VTIRAAGAGDAAAIAEILRSSAEAAQWDPAGYDVTVGEISGCVVAFLVTRAIDEREMEILNLAVAAGYRRKGVARQLVLRVLEQHRGEVFLEVRESNTAARKLYESLGFKELSRRANYYQNPLESGIVMKFHSC